MRTAAPEPERFLRIAPAWRQALTLALLIAVLAGLAASETLHQAFLRLIAGVESFIGAHPIWGISLFILLSALSAMLAFFSTAVITPIAVHTWGELGTIVLLWVGWMLGGLCAYGIGRTLGRPVVLALTSGAALARFERRISTRAPFGVVLLFQLALPSEIPGYILGLVRYGLARYLGVLAIAELPFVIGTVYLGASFLERRMTTLLAIGALGVAFTAWALHALQKRFPA
jgi:uncharacterized membrane protein YdjX (TVP38/TMEM64 family)